MDDILVNRQTQFPQIPDDVSESMKAYLKELQATIDRQIRGTFDTLRSISDTSTGATTFLGLTDTPSAYTTAAGKFVVVNTASNALVFVNTGTFSSILMAGTLNFASNQAIALVLQVVTSDPASPVTAQIWYRSDL